MLTDETRIKPSSATADTGEIRPDAEQKHAVWAVPKQHHP